MNNILSIEVCYFRVSCMTKSLMNKRKLHAVFQRRKEFMFEKISTLPTF